MKGQVDDLLGRVRERAAKGERTLVTTLTKRMAEDLTNYFLELGVRARYLHSDVETLERVQILGDLRRGVFDVLVGINLLREGLDLPEVSLVAILDADKEGFLRSETSLVQTAGRAARNLNGLVVFYADVVTDSMRRAMNEMARRRATQEAYNVEHGIVPESIVKAIDSPLLRMANLDYGEGTGLRATGRDALRDDRSIEEEIASLTKEMKESARELEFEKAARLRDRIRELRGMVRPDDERQLGLRFEEGLESGSVVPAGESPVPVSAGAPGSRPQAGGETRPVRAGRQEPPNRGEQQRGRQH